MIIIISFLILLFLLLIILVGCKDIGQKFAYGGAKKKKAKRKKKKKKAKKKKGKSGTASAPLGESAPLEVDMGQFFNSNSPLFNFVYYFYNLNNDKTYDDFIKNHKSEFEKFIKYGYNIEPEQFKMPAITFDKYTKDSYYYLEKDYNNLTFCIGDKSADDILLHQYDSTQQFSLYNTIFFKLNDKNIDDIIKDIKEEIKWMTNPSSMDFDPKNTNLIKLIDNDCDKLKKMIMNKFEKLKNIFNLKYENIKTKLSKKINEIIQLRNEWFSAFGKYDDTFYYYYYRCDNIIELNDYKNKFDDILNESFTNNDFEKWNSFYRGLLNFLSLNTASHIFFKFIYTKKTPEDDYLFDWLNDTQFDICLDKSDCDYLYIDFNKLILYYLYMKYLKPIPDPTKLGQFKQNLNDEYKKFIDESPLYSVFIA
jgi:hypothetical protein